MLSHAVRVTYGAFAWLAIWCRATTGFLAMPAEHVYVPNKTPLMTAEDLLKPGVPERADLVRGVLVVHEPPGFRHGEITVRLTIALGT